MDELSTIIYKSNNTYFFPTKKFVSEPYENGEVGDQLWEQMYNGLLCGNMYTLKEILHYNPIRITL